MKVYKIFLLAGLAFSMYSCKKDSPIEDLGTSSGEYKAQLSVALSNRTPALGETTVVTATTSHRDDKITKVEFLHTLTERFGVYLSLDNTVINTWDEESPLMIVRDTIANNVAWKTVSGNNKELDSYFVTNSNLYVVPAEYFFVQENGKYDLNGSSLLLQLPAESFEIIKSQLALNITVADYLTLFPAAPDDHFTFSGTTKTSVSATGKAYLKANLTRQNIIDNGLKEIHKEGVFTSTINVRVTAGNGVTREVSNSIESAY